MTKQIITTDTGFFNSDLLKLNLQFFADPTDPPVDPPADPQDPPQDPPVEPTAEEKELEKKIEAESDRKLAKALEKKQKEWEKELEKKIADAKKDAESYAKMTATEKVEAERKKEREDFEKEKSEFNQRKLKSEIEFDLKENGLPTSFAQSLISVGDNEKIKESIVQIKKEFDEAINLAVKEKLRQDPPPAGSKNINNNNLSNSKAEMARKNRIIK